MQFVSLISSSLPAHSAKEEDGFFLLELMFVIMLFGVMAMGLCLANRTSMDSRVRAFIRCTALEIASDDLEQYAAINPINLSDTNDFIRTTNKYGLMFRETVDVTTNANGSRTVDVTIASLNAHMGSTVSLSGTYPIWESL